MAHDDYMNTLLMEWAKWREMIEHSSIGHARRSITASAVEGRSDNDPKAIDPNFKCSKSSFVIDDIFEKDLTNEEKELVTVKYLMGGTLKSKAETLDLSVPVFRHKSDLAVKAVSVLYRTKYPTYRDWAKRLPQDVVFCT